MSPLMIVRKHAVHLFADRTGALNPKPPTAAPTPTMALLAPPADPAGRPLGVEFWYPEREVPGGLLPRLYLFTLCTLLPLLLAFELEIPWTFGYGSAFICFGYGSGFICFILQYNFREAWCSN